MKLKVRKFLGQTYAFVEVTKENPACRLLDPILYLKLIYTEMFLFRFSKKSKKNIFPLVPVPIKLVSILIKVADVMEMCTFKNALNVISKLYPHLCSVQHCVY